jgi:hypothetical protein
VVPDSTVSRPGNQGDSAGSGKVKSQKAKVKWQKWSGAIGKTHRRDAEALRRTEAVLKPLRLRTSAVKSFFLLAGCAAVPANGLLLHGHLKRWMRVQVFSTA